MEEKRICIHCQTGLTEDEGRFIDEELLCDECLDDYCITCDRCGEIIWTKDCITDDNAYLCRECFDNHYHRCESCDRIIHDEDSCWHNELPYCCNCFDDDEIEDYSCKLEPLFRGDGNRFLGVEIELDCGGKDNDNAYRIKSIGNNQLENIYIKADSSLDDGFEIVSHPMTLQYHMDEMDWESILQEAVNMGYRSDQTSTCGLHTHINRNAFGDNQAEQEEVIGKILFFIEKHWAEMFRFSRRDSYNMNRWSARYGFEKTGKEILDKAKSGNNGRYVAVNLNNYHTIEFRLFRGTLKYNTFIAILQLVDEICNVAFSMSEREIDDMSWSSFVSTITESELVQYLKERQLYINEKISIKEKI